MILMFGDTHGNFGHILPAVEAEKPVAIILLGDVQAQQPLELELKHVMELTDVYWIPGNHDTDSRADYDNLFNSQLADRNLHGKVTEIDGLRVAGLGGVFREKSWYPRFDAYQEPEYKSYKALIDSEMQAEKWGRYRELNKQGQLVDGLPDPSLIGMALTHKSTIFYDEWLKLYGQRADILVTHEAPSCHPNGFVAIDVLAQSVGIKYAFHGHQHDSLNYRSDFERLAFEAHGVGFCGITDMYGRRVAAGDYDEARSHRQYRNERMK